MANPELHIVNGPGERDLEQAFIARKLGARAEFTIFVVNHEPLSVRLKILNFDFITCHGPKYKLGGHLQVREEDKVKLPPFNFIFVDYNAEDRRGKMEFSNGE